MVIQISKFFSYTYPESFNSSNNHKQKHILSMFLSNILRTLQLSSVLFFVVRRSVPLFNADNTNWCWKTGWSYLYYASDCVFNSNERCILFSYPIPFNFGLLQCSQRQDFARLGIYLFIWLTAPRYDLNYFTFFCFNLSNFPWTLVINVPHRSARTWNQATQPRSQQS